MNQAFEKRLSALNNNQRRAVDYIDGPLLVLAGPGTGKTELLSMRTAQILRQTDTLASSILCLTFTESGAVAMRERLRGIIGADAYKVAIHTFHGFGSEIINQHREYFYHGADFQPADELMQYEILRSIFTELDYTDPLAGSNGEEYTYLKDAQTVISELKRSGLTSDEVRGIISTNEQVLDALERDIAAVFADRISNKTIERLAPVAQKAAEVTQADLPVGITPLANVLALSIAHAVEDATETNSTKPITAWKNAWCEKNDKGELVFKDRKRHLKLRALTHVYFEYMRRMEEAGLFDYDDMILQVIHALETQPDLAANLRERYLYIMVDEFQDTSLAQLRMLFSLAPNSDANIMAVGDDDQAIYSFQGADVSNIHSFRTKYDDPPIVVLTDNYRSTATVLKQARQVIVESDGRLEANMEGLSKELTAHKPDSNDVKITEYASVMAERRGVAQSVRKLLDDGAAPENIAIFARRHHELITLLPYLSEEGILVNYERRDDALSHDVIRIVEHLLLIIDNLHSDEHDAADSLIPEILSHPAFGYDPADIYRLSLSSYRNHKMWLETMQTIPVFTPMAEWLIERAARIHTDPLEEQIDDLLGLNKTNDTDGETEARFVSPLGDYFFGEKRLDKQPDIYLDALEALRTVRDRVREHTAHDVPSVRSFLDFISMHRELGTPVTITRHRSEQVSDRVNLMTAHKSKGLEFEHVFIVGAVDNMWGERVRVRSRLIGYPENLMLAPAGDSYDERVRLFYVAMTRAKTSLSISYSTTLSDDKPALAASFLSELDIPVEGVQPTDIKDLTIQSEIDWRGHLAEPMRPDMKELLRPTLEKYKLSATHIGNFLDIERGGPRHFLLNNLLRFPQAKSASARFGTAIHGTLQRAHDHFLATGKRRPLEDILGDYERLLREQHLPSDEIDTYLSRGIDALSAFLDAEYGSFTTTQRTELGFGGQDVTIGGARLTGSLDLVDIDDTAKTIRVTDYKTGKPSRDWRGKSEYEKMKLHHYRQQLMFYQLLVENSRDYSKYKFAGGVLQFVEPSNSGDILKLEDTFSDDDMTRFKLLISAIWNRIINLDLPDISDYPPTLKGIEKFEQDLIDNYDGS